MSAAVPKQVKAQADKAREALDQFKKAQQEAEAAAEEAAAAHAQNQPPDAPPPASSQPPTTEPPPAQEPLEEDWKHKYEVLQGKYSSEVPQLAEELRRTRGLVEQLQSELEALRKDPSALEPTKSLISQEEIDEFGPELYDFVKRVARAELLPELESRITPVKQTAESAATTVAKTARERFMEALEADPDYHKYNSDQGFLQWLAQVDPMVGVRRQDLLDRAVAANDVARTLAFFKAYKAVADPAPPTAAVTDPRPTPADFVTPGGAPPATPEGSEKKIWTKKEVEDFFSRGQRRTKFSDLTTEQAEKIRAEIAAATAEGRIRL